MSWEVNNGTVQIVGLYYHQGHHQSSSWPDLGRQRLSRMAPVLTHLSHTCFLLYLLVKWIPFGAVHIRPRRIQRNS